MKSYGRENHSHNYVDNHPPKGFINWWESETDGHNKKRARQQSKKEIDEEIYQRNVKTNC